MMIWERFSGDVADVPVVSPTSQSRWEKMRPVQLFKVSPKHRRHVPVDTGTSRSPVAVWKPGLTRRTGKTVLTQNDEECFLGKNVSERIRLLRKKTSTSMNKVTTTTWYKYVV